MSKTDARTWFERNPKKTLISVTFLLCVLADFLAGSLFIAEAGRDHHPYYHHGFKRKRKIQHEWGENKAIIYTDSLGFKSSGRGDVALVTNKYRILIMGDSFAEGVGRAYDETFSGLIARILESSEFDVLNGGVVSYSPKIYYLKVKYLLEEMKLKFDKLYVFIDISDVYDEFAYYQDFFPGKRDKLPLAKEIDSFFKEHSCFYYFLSKHGLNPLAGRGLTNQEVAEWTHNGETFRAWGEAGLGLARENMERLVSLCKDNGISIGIAVYPWPVQISRRDLDCVHARFWRSFAEKHNIEFLDYFPDFIRELDPDEAIAAYFVKGDIHWNKKGHELIARKLVERIRQEGRK